MATPQQRIDKLTEELRDLYDHTNEGPRLIAEMVAREFPHPRKVLNGPSALGRKGSGDWGMNATDYVGR
jgi:hypothetical protein